MDLIQYSSDSESAEEIDKLDKIPAETTKKSSEGKDFSLARSRRDSPDNGKRSKDKRDSKMNLDSSEDSDEKSSRKHKRSSSKRKSKERESSHKKPKSRRERSEERDRSPYESRKHREHRGGRDRHHSSRNDYDEKRYKTDKYRHDDRSSRRDDRYSDRPQKSRSDSDRHSSRYSESDKYRRSSRDERRRRHRSRSYSRSRSQEKREKRHRSHSKSKEREKSDKRVELPIVQTSNLSDKEKSKSPEISAVVAPPINNVNPMAAERKLAKLDQLGITLHANTLQATSGSTTGVKIPDGVEIPAYYNPNAINVTKYAEQIQKRKLLWSGKKAEPVAASSTWNKATFSQDTDGKVASKFMRLMGIKDAQAIPKPPEKEETVADKQKELFSTMEQQYEVARQVTHTMRGVGLGFGAPPRQF